MNKAMFNPRILRMKLFGLCLGILCSCEDDTVNPPPPPPPPPIVAGFTASPTLGKAPLTVAFTDQSTGGDMTTWNWSFGDGITSSSKNPSHLYSNAGSYTVTLTVSGPSDSDAETKSSFVTVTEPPPPVPTGLTVSKTYSEYITCSWNLSQGANGYKVYRATTGTYSLVRDNTSTYWSDIGVDMARWYYYKVSAYSAGGESAQSGSVSGYRTGWRFENESIYNTSIGIGLCYNLYAFGFQGSPKAVAVYAVYKSGSSYYYVPGSGSFGKAAYVFSLTPGYPETVWTNNCASIYDDTWDPGWRNNNYPQYVKMRVYKYQYITSLGSSFFDETAYFSISWGNGPERPPTILRKLSPEESALIDSQLLDAPVQGGISSTNAVSVGLGGHSHIQGPGQPSIADR